MAFDYLHRKDYIYGYLNNKDIVLDPFNNVKLMNYTKVFKNDNIDWMMLKRLDINYEYLAPEYFDNK